MKKVYSIILSIAALFTVAFTASAQEPGPYSIAKQITDPKNGNKAPKAISEKHAISIAPTYQNKNEKQPQANIP